MERPTDSVAAVTRPDPERSDSLRLVTVSSTAGIVAAIGGPAPTGTTSIDMLFVAGSVGLLTGIAHRTPVPTALAAAVIAAVLSLSLPVAASIAAVATISLTLVRPRVGQTTTAGMLAGAALAGAAHSELGGWYGASAIVGGAVAAALAIPPLRSSPTARRVAVRTTIGLIGFVALALAVGGALASSALDDARRAERAIDTAIDELRHGRVEEAADALAAAADELRRAGDRLDHPLVRPLAVVPVAAHHRRVGRDVVATAAAAAATAADRLGRVDSAQLLPSPGRFDLAEIDRLRDDLIAVGEAVDEVADALERSDDGWLLPRLSDELADVDARIDDASAGLVDAVRHLETIETFLGSDTPRRHVVIFTTPSELTDLGGSVVAWTEVIAERGITTLGESATPADLTASASPDLRDDLDRAMSTPHVPSAAATFAAVVEHLDGREVDGVVLIDVIAAAELLRVTGPIETSNVPGQPRDAASHLLHEQYLSANGGTDDIVEFSRSLLSRLLTSATPDLLDLYETLDPLIESDRVRAWSPDPDEQSSFVALGMAGEMDLDARDSLAISFRNLLGNRIDHHARARASYEATVGPGGATVASVDIAIENRAPPNGEPARVIGNAAGLPSGTNRVDVSIHSRLPSTAVVVDGEPVNSVIDHAHGHVVTTVRVDLAPGEVTSLRVELAGHLDVTAPPSLSLRSPPTTRPTPITAQLTDGSQVETVDLADSGRVVVAWTTPGSG